MTRFVLGLDPQTARCVAVFELSDLDAVEAGESQGFKVANGIAYRPSNGHFVVTGKNWRNMFEISLAEDPGGNAARALADHLGAAAALAQGGYSHAQMGGGPVLPAI